MICGIFGMSVLDMLVYIQAVEIDVSYSSYKGDL